MRELKIIVEKHPEGYVAYPLGLKGVVVGEGDTYEDALERLSHNYPTTNRNYTIVQKSKKRFLSNSMHIYSQTFLKLQKHHLEECVS